MVIVEMLLVFIRLVGMVVQRFVCSAGMRMGMCMNMLMSMGVNQTAVAVRMGMDMRMLVGMLQADGIADHENRRGDHDAEAEIGLYAGPLVQQEHAESDAAERGEGNDAVPRADGALLRFDDPQTG